ncbi:MAG: hypothetical protein IPM51_05965 [Sphingobacteriaceae bacterium]|nr:hypothetical protein [Sphingobacteriaceae bacterium]
MSKYSISKSSYLKFEQCKKAFFLNKHFPQLKDKFSIDKNLTFKRGHLIGSLSKELFPNGIDVSEESKNLEEAALLTTNLIAEKKTIYEATFVYNGVLIMVDILTWENGGWNAYEIKSSLKVTEVYLLDACLQHYVLNNSIDHLKDFFLVTLNGDYIKNEEQIDLKKLFKKRSILKEALANSEYFQARINAANEVLECPDIPQINIGEHCFKPYTCDFYGYCWKNTIQNSNIFSISIIN